MANVTVSARCNLRCSYCFAAASMAAAPPSEQFLSLVDFERRLDFLERSGIREVRLMGGEPTLHPQLPELLHRALASLDRVLVFTNGCIPERSLAALLDVDPDRLGALVNMTAYEGDGTSNAVHERRTRTLSALGPRAMAGITLVRPSLEYDWLPALMREVGCRPALRVGLGHRALGSDNDFLHPKQYGMAAAGIVRLASVAADHGVRVELDCGFVRCMFSDDDLARLAQLDADVGWHCGPVCDIELDGRMTHCFPLSTLPGVEWPGRGSDAPSVRQRLAGQTAPFHGIGVYRECSSCRFHASGECTGGCRSAAMARLHRTEFQVALPTSNPTTLHTRRPVPSTGGPP